MPKKAGTKNEESRTRAKVSPTKNGALQPAEPRRLALPKRVWYKPWTWVRDIPAPPREPIPAAWSIMGESLRTTRQNWKVFTGIALIFGVLNVLLVTGLSDPTGLSEFKQLLSSVWTGASGQVLTLFNSFMVLLTTSNSKATESSGLYQTVLLIVVSLALIWAFRQAVAGHKQRVRDGFYRGMSPLVPFLLVLVVFSLQLIPAIIGGFIYTTAARYGIANDFGQKAAFALVVALLAGWSLRMIIGTIFALYIVTLPDMTPLRALRSAKELVYKRRLLILRKLLFLPVTLLLVAILIEIPLILFATPLAYWVFFIYSMGALIFVHGYLYALYRKLL